VSDEEKNKALVRRLIEEVDNRGNLDVADELLARNFVDHDVFPQEDGGIQGYKRAVTEQRVSSSDLHFSIEEQIAEGEKVVTRYIGSGTVDQEEYEGVPPTGVRITIENITINRVVEGKIVEERTVSDTSPLWEQRMEQERIERARVEQELLVARRIQRALLPKAVPALLGWQISPHYQPAREVGGDFYDFLLLADGRVGLVIGDVSGKGIPAAVLMASTQSVLRAVSQRGDPTSLSPGQVLAEANEVICSYVPPNMFVTCFYAILDPESGRLSYANAGHTLPCCSRHDEDQEAYELVARGMPLGLMPGMDYEEKEAALLPGDSALFCTDGLVEAHDPKGAMFGAPRLRGVLSERRPESGRGLSATLMEELRRFTGEGWEQEDDITLLALERSTTRS
jgi:serine phosphatase RsbU (regulator of sigma subunit)/predicted ester cyclase